MKEPKRDPNWDISEAKFLKSGNVIKRYALKRYWRSLRAWYKFQINRFKKGFIDDV